ncbi:MAG: S1C family serine protease [Oceanipulchritudo sp.]
MSGCPYRLRPLGLFVLAAGFFTIPLSGQANADFRGLEERIVSLFEENKSALVRVKAIYPPREAEEIPQVVIGSGFFISREGLILTNASIVSDPLRVWVEHDDIAYSAEILGLDARSNVAFLRTHTLPGDFSFLHLVDSAELPVIGSFLLRLSMPLEFDPSPHFGIVAGFESRFGERFFPCTYIRTNVPAGPGDGGSAYLDLTGRLIGIQVGSLPDVGSSYILPARAALRIRDDILFSGRVTYGWIGFEVETETSIENGRRLTLSQVFAETPAEEAGLMEGDVLLQIGDYPIRVLDDLRNAIFYTRVGQYVDVRVLREGEMRRFNIKVAARPENEPMEVVETVPPEPPIEPIKEKDPNEKEGPGPFEEDLRKEDPVREEPLETVPPPVEDPAG